jgi:hypothetical protein
MCLKKGLIKGLEEEIKQFEPRFQVGYVSSSAKPDEQPLVKYEKGNWYVILKKTFN